MVMRAGARDFVRKDSLERLPEVIRRELGERDQRRRRRLAEADLRASESLFRLLAENSLDVIFRCELEPVFAVVYVSPAACDELGCSADELLGDPQRLLAMVTDQEQRAVLEDQWRRGLPGVSVLRWRMPDGSLRWVEQRSHPVWADNRLMAVEGVFRNVTERILGEEERGLLTRQLEQADRLDSLGLLAGGLAHDVNNSLAVILAGAALIEDELPVDHGCLPDIHRIANAANRSAMLTRRLLLFARGEAETKELFDVRQVVLGLTDMFERAVGEDVTVTVSVVPGAWHVVMDRGAFEQVIVNLVANARAAMPYGGRLAVTAGPASVAAGDVSELPPGEYVRVAVVDTGVGMAPEVARRVFDPFFTTRRRGEGTGLGLSIAHGVVKQAGGEISVRSVPDHGTTVSIHLPLAQSEPPKPPVKEPNDGVIVGDGRTVLIVDDDESVRDMLARMLRRQRFNVIAVGSAHEAIAVCSSDVPVDVVVSDVVMPVMSGPELGQYLRDLRPDLPVMYVSGFVAEEFSGRGSDLPGVLLRKPFTAHELTRALASCGTAAVAQEASR